MSDACHCQDRDIVKDKLDAEDSNSARPGAVFFA